MCCPHRLLSHLADTNRTHGVTASLLAYPRVSSAVSLLPLANLNPPTPSAASSSYALLRISFHVLAHPLFAFI